MMSGLKEEQYSIYLVVKCSFNGYGLRIQRQGWAAAIDLSAVSCYASLSPFLFRKWQRS